jgi:hypothetical protein
VPPYPAANRTLNAGVYTSTRSPPTSTSWHVLGDNASLVRNALRWTFLVGKTGSGEEVSGEAGVTAPPNICKLDGTREVAGHTGLGLQTPKACPRQLDSLGLN